jgi:hypothetical protein
MGGKRPKEPVVVEQAKADELAREVLYMHGPEQADTEARRRVYEGVAYEAAETLPPNARAAVIQRPDHEAMLVAVVSDRLYVIEFDPPENATVATVTTTVYPIDPARDRVSRDVQHRVGERGHYRSIDWHFDIAGRPLTIQTHVGADGEVDGREALARSLAEALGWHSPPDVLEYRIEAV